MGMSLRVAKVHKIEFADAKVSGYFECEDFIKRLDEYAEILETDTPHENGYGEGHMEHEIPRWALNEIFSQSDEWFAENGKIEDKEVIKYLIEQSDKDEEYVFIYCF